MIKPGQIIHIDGQAWEARHCHESHLDETVWWHCRRVVGRWFFGLLNVYTWGCFSDEELTGIRDGKGRVI